MYRYTFVEAYKQNIYSIYIIFYKENVFEHLKDKC